MLYRLLIILLLFNILSDISFSQNVYYPYYTTDTTHFAKLADECSKRVESSFIVPEKVSRDYRKDFINTKTESAEYTRSLVRYTAITDSIINPFIQSVYKKISDANPSLAGYTIIVSDWPIMNAANVGGNVIVFYAPLLSRFQSEGEVAAILCHELAHGELDHIQKGLKKHLDEYYKKEFQKELKTTMKEEFDLNSKINLLALKFTFSSRYHSRALEKSADSLGYIFLSKTNYDASKMVSALEVLKHVDEPISDSRFNYTKYFGCESATFDFTSVKPYRKVSIFETTETSEIDTLTDTLRTHPDCDKRISYIEELKKKFPAKVTPVMGGSAYEQIQWFAAMEMIHAYYVYEYYDYALFNALLYFEMRPDDDYLKTIISLCLSGIYRSLKDHELSDYISNYSEENPVAFNDFLFFINNLRLKDLSSFINCFYQKNVSSIQENEFFIAASYCCSKMNEDGNAKKWQDKYSNNYKKGRFYNLLDLNPKPGKKKKK